MNTSRTIDSRRPVGGDCFYLKYTRSSNKYLKDYINKFNPNDYYIFKGTGKQRQVSYEDFLDFKWSNYILFKKDIYSIDHINKWVEWWNKLGGIQYLIKPFPPFNPNKIKIKL